MSRCIRDGVSYKRHQWIWKLLNRICKACGKEINIPETTVVL